MGAITRLERSDEPEHEMVAAGLSAYRWTAGPEATFAPHRHEATKHLYVTNGSIDFDGLSLSAGDGIRIPAGTLHSAIVGSAGVTCIEAFEA